MVDPKCQVSWSCCVYKIRLEGLSFCSFFNIVPYCNKCSLTHCVSETTALPVPFIMAIRHVDRKDSKSH